MFNEADISALVDRLGWSENESIGYVGILNDKNLTRDSGITLNSFHPLVTLENLHNCQPDEHITNDIFNDYLTEILDNVVRSILTDVFTDFKGNDYSGIISGSIDAGLFDNAIGYCHAVKIVEVLAATVRSNRIETIAGFQYGQLAAELKGFSNKEGVLVSKGLIHYCEGHRNAIREKIFGGGEAVICDGTNLW